MATYNVVTTSTESRHSASFANLPSELLIQVYNYLDTYDREAEDGVQTVSMNPRSFSRINRECHRASLSGTGATIVIKDPMASFFSLDISDFDGDEPGRGVDLSHVRSSFSRGPLGLEPSIPQPNISSSFSYDELLTRYRKTAASRAQTWIILDAGYHYQIQCCLDFLTHGVSTGVFTSSDLLHHIVLDFSKDIQHGTERSLAGTADRRILRSAIELTQYSQNAHIHYYPHPGRIELAWVDVSSPAAHLSVYGSPKQMPGVEYFRGPQHSWMVRSFISYHCHLPALQPTGSDPSDSGVEPAQAAQDLIAILKDRASKPGYGRATRVICQIPADGSKESEEFKNAFEAARDGLDDMMNVANFEISWKDKND